MNKWTMTIMLQFPMMPRPRPVTVDFAQLRFLDCNAERLIQPDGSVIYLRTNRWPITAEMCNA